MKKAFLFFIVFGAILILTPLSVQGSSLQREIDPSQITTFPGGADQPPVFAIPGGADQPPVFVIPGGADSPPQPKFPSDL